MPRFVLKMTGLQDTAIVTTEDEQELLCELSMLSNSNDLE